MGVDICTEHMDKQYTWDYCNKKRDCGKSTFSCAMGYWHILTLRQPFPITKLRFSTIYIFSIEMLLYPTIYNVDVDRNLELLILWIFFKKLYNKYFKNKFKLINKQLHF